ncbi:hypothetical protein D9613_009105 [Agrocybe pediades]|uniref:rRNA methyltransferase 2, mitochondrial n=1 Tax=Agrocybe pediades TaxID=84607 RepID=A0A8H4VTL7_9AGAR|nr:hypothetical protein D9613_009105 [Agrocybe pediades]
MAFRQSFITLSQKSKSKSASWASRQIRDPYVKKRLVDPAAYRARSAFKLLEINSESNGFLDYPDVSSVVDLGAAPGGWSQVVAEKFGWSGTTSSIMPLKRYASWEEQAAATEGPEPETDPVDEEESLKEKKIKKRVKLARKKVVQQELDHFDPLNIDDVEENLSRVQGRGTIVAVDLLKIEPIPGVKTIQADFLEHSTTLLLKDMLRTQVNPDGKADVILSDMAANVSGNNIHDIQSSLEICEAVFEFARWNLRPAQEIGRRRGGVLLMKFFAHPLLERFRDERLKPNFNFVTYIKPDSSRATSREGYFLCQGWRPTVAAT